MSNHELTETELYRKSVVNLTQRVEILEQAVADEQKMKYNAYKRIADLNVELNLLKGTK